MQLPPWIATEISILLREKDEKIAQLEQQLQVEKANLNQQAAEQIFQLQQNMELLKISHKANIFAKNVQVQELQEAMEKYEDVPTVEEFIKEALELNSLLLKQQEQFFQMMSHIAPYLITSDQLKDKAIDQRTEFTVLNKRISKFIEWQEIEEGRRANLPEIKETHKDILFTDWDVRIKQDELAMAKAARVLKNIVKVVNHTLYATNLVKEGNPKILPNLNDLHKS